MAEVVETKMEVMVGNEEVEAVLEEVPSTLYSYCWW